MNAIVSDEYRQEEADLRADPIVQDMAKGLAGEPVAELRWPDGTPRHVFMLAASREYHARGGQLSRSMGGVARALLTLVEEA